MSYRHLTMEERACISQLLQNGATIREIARAIGRSPSTVSRELRRNDTPSANPRLGGRSYFPQSSDRRYRKRISRAHRAVLYPRRILYLIELRLRQTWSPEQISGYYRAKGEPFPSARTIYKWIGRGLLAKGDKKVLRRKGKSGETRGKFNAGKPIRKRPKSVYKRRVFGHWEADSVVPGRGKSKACFVTLAERRSRLYLVRKVRDHSAAAAADAIIAMLKGFPRSMVRTITCDRGAEFADWRRIEEELGCEVYFCNPFCAWQKGTNENSNGLLREFFRKGWGFGNISQKAIDKACHLINSRPRKCLKWKSSEQVVKEHLKRCT